MPTHNAVTLRLSGITPLIKKAAPKKARQTALVTAVKKGFWTPNNVSDELMVQVQAKVNRLQQMHLDVMMEMQAAESVMMMMTGDKLSTGTVHPKTHEMREMELEIKYIHVIINVLLKISKPKIFDNAIAFLHYLREEAWKRGMSQSAEKEPTIFDIDNGCGEIFSLPTMGNASFYEPPLELVEAAKFFLRVRHYKLARDADDQRVIKLDEATSIINLGATDRVKEAFGLPNQQITAIGSVNDMPEWAVMLREGKTLGLYRRTAAPHAIMIYNGNSAEEACQYEVY